LANPEGVTELSNRDSVLRTLSEFLLTINELPQGVALGWNLQTPFGVPLGCLNQSLITQERYCHVLTQVVLTSLRSTRPKKLSTDHETFRLPLSFTREFRILELTNSTGQLNSSSNGS
jgi:hypothetical protein